MYTMTHLLEQPGFCFLITLLITSNHHMHGKQVGIFYKSLEFLSLGNGKVECKGGGKSLSAPNSRHSSCQAWK